MPHQTFEDVICWQKAKLLSVSVYGVFKNCKDFSFRDQIQRASVSVMNNIAEGYERNTQKELKYFLYISKGSCGEVRSMLILAKELGLINEVDYLELNNTSVDTSRLLAGFIKKLS